MPKTDQEILSAFQNADTDKDNLLSEDELKNALEALKIELKSDIIEGYVKSSYSTKEKHINMEVFALMVRFTESQLAHMPEMLVELMKSLWFFIQSQKENNAFYSEDANIKVSLEEEPSEDMQTSVSVFAGDMKSNSELKEAVAQEVASPLALFFDVKLENANSIVNDVNEKLKATKALMAEISKEVAEVLQNVEIKASVISTGLRITIDLSKVPTFAALLKVLESSMMTLVKQPVSIYAKASAEIDMSNMEVPLLSHTEEAFQFDMEVKNLSLCHTMKNESLRSAFKKAIDEKKSMAPLGVLCLPMKKFNVKAELNKKMWNDFLSVLKIPSKNVTMNELVEKGVKFMKDNQVSDYLEMFGDAMEMLKVFRDNEASEVGVFIKVYDVYMGCQVKVDLWDALYKLLNLD